MGSLGFRVYRVSVCLGSKRVEALLSSLDLDS